MVWKKTLVRRYRSLSLSFIAMQTPHTSLHELRRAYIRREERVEEEFFRLAKRDWVWHK